VPDTRSLVHRLANQVHAEPHPAELTEHDVPPLSR
jgi:hypothetical protein